MSKPSEEFRSAMSEETKPVEREAFERWAKSKEMSVLRYGGTQFTLDYLDGATDRAWEVWHASADATLERAAQRIDEYFSGDPCTECEDLRDAILALKGSR